MDLIELLSCLGDGEYHSGVELGALLGVSRTAVWKSLSKLERYGVVIEATKGKGYRIKGGVDLLDEEVIREYLMSAPVPVEDFHLLQDVDSTNSFLMELDDVGKGYSVCLAERQSAGRGRRGREWHSPYAKNLYLSLSFGLAGGGEVLEGLSLALGVGVANCLSGQGIENVGLKWPNDIWVGDKKLAGILVELKGEAEFGWKIVVGLGINILMSDVEVDLGQPWTSIDRLAEDLPICRSEWAGLLIKELIKTIEGYRAFGLDGLMDDWGRFDVLRGRSVVLSGGGGGECLGIDARGRLLVSSGGNVVAINAGEVSVRPDDSTN